MFEFRPCANTATRLLVPLGFCLRNVVAAVGILVLASCTSSKGGGNLLEDISRIDLSSRPAKVAQAQPSAAPVQQPTGSRMFVDGNQAAPTPDAATVAGAVTEVAGGYQINLQNAPLADAARSLLQDVLKVTYSIDPRAQGTITLATGGAISMDQLLIAFESTLQMNDLTLVQEAGLYRIIPASIANEGLAADVSNDPASVSPGYGLTAYPVRRVKAEKLAQTLDGFAARAGMVRASASGNLLLFRGSASERRALSEIVASLDTDALAGRNSGMAFLRNTNADTVFDELEAMARDASPSGTLRLVPVQRVNGILIVAQDRQQLTEAMEWVRRLDQATDEGDGTHVYHVQFARAGELAKVLSSTFGTPSGVKAGKPVAAQPDAETPAENAGETSPPIAMPQDAGAEPVPENISSSGSDDIRFTANDTDNTIIIRAPGYVYRQITSLLRTLDRPPVQVLINVVLAEVTLNDALRYGVQAYLHNSEVSLVSAARLPVGFQMPGVNVLIGQADNPKVILDALSKVTDVKVVSSPSIVALDNESAVIKVGDQVPVTTQQVVGIQTSDAPVVNSIEYRDAGVVLKVRPHVSDTGLVTMNVLQELSAVVADASGAATLTPVLRQRSITSTVAVYDQQTVVLGGLISTQQTKSKQSLPFLGDIPVLGNLAGTTGNDVSRTELVVFITPKVIRDQNDASEVANELRSKLRLFKD